MPDLALVPPFSAVEPVTDILHGVPVTDPYRWLENQESPRTREWIEQQTLYARTYLDNIPGRNRVRERIREFLAVETHDSVQKVGNRYFFRKRLPNQEQPCIYMRDGIEGADQLLIDPAERHTGRYTAVRPVRVSPNGRLLLYEIKQGGERTGTFELLEVESGRRLPDSLPSGILRGLVFASDCKVFYYSHEPVEKVKTRDHRAIFRHVLGDPPSADEEIFRAGEGERFRLFVVAGECLLGIYLNKCFDKTYTDFYVRSFQVDSPLQRVLMDADFLFEPYILKDRILAITDCASPNRRIVRVHSQPGTNPEFTDIVPEYRRRINAWTVAGTHLFVSYANPLRPEIHIYDIEGHRLGDMPTSEGETIRFFENSPSEPELLAETESFVEPPRIFSFACSNGHRIPFAERKIPLSPEGYGVSRVSYVSKDGAQIPMFLVGKNETLAGGIRPTIMTSYGGYGVSMTPQFSVFVAFLLEHNCLFALPNIRGGSEFGAEWHHAARRRNRQTAYDDFLAAADWLIETGRTTAGQLAIFGGSNSGLLVAVALTQRPALVRAVVCMVPLLDMLRYHLFDRSHIWKDEFGTAEDEDDFAALAAYSPYHQVRGRAAYPATMIVSGDADTVCNALHARKMTARLQAANSSKNPILLDYSKYRGHSAVLPLSERIEALTDRMAFLCDQLRIAV